MATDDPKHDDSNPVVDVMEIEGDDVWLFARDDARQWIVGDGVDVSEWC